MAIPTDLPPIARDATTGAVGPGGRTAPTGAGQSARGAQQSAHASGHDRVEVSDYARLLSKLDPQVAGSADERSALIAELRASIDAGTYTMDARKVAERLLPSMEHLT